MGGAQLFQRYCKYSSEFVANYDKFKHVYAKAVRKAAWGAWHQRVRAGESPWPTELWPAAKRRVHGALGGGKHDGLHGHTSSAALSPPTFDTQITEALSREDALACKVNLRSLFKRPHNCSYHHILHATVDTHILRPQASYSQTCLSSTLSKHIASFRLECSTVNAHTLYTKPLLLRTCEYCRAMHNITVHENEFHVAMICPLYHQIRGQLFRECMHAQFFVSMQCDDVYDIYIGLLNAHGHKYVKLVARFLSQMRLWQ